MAAVVGLEQTATLVMMAAETAMLMLEIEMLEIETTKQMLAILLDTALYGSVPI